MLPLGRFFGCNQTSDCQGRRRSHACVRDIPVVGYRVRMCVFLEKFAHFLRRSCTAVPALRSPCGSNTEAIRAFCPELRLHGAGMVLPSPGVLSLGPNCVELEIKE